MRRNAFRNTLAAVLVLATVAAACGDDDDDAATTAPAATTATTKAPSSSTGSTTAGSTATTAGGSTTTAKPKPASGEPIKVGFISTEAAALNTASGRFAAQAATAYVNEELGGVHGRPLALDTCAVLGTADSSVSCANQLVDKKPVVIYRASDSGNAASIPIYTAASIPYYQPYGAGRVENTTDGVYNFNGSFTNYAVLAQFAKDQGWPKVGILAIGVPQVTDGYTNYGKDIFATLGVGINFSTFEPTAADFTPYLQAASQGASVVLVVGIPSNCISAANARDALALKVPLMVHTSCWSADVAKALGPGTYVIGDDTSAIPEDPDNQLFLAQMKKRAPDTNPDGLAATGFLGLINLYRVLNTIPASSDITTATVSAAFKATKGLPLFMFHGAKATCDGNQIKGLVSVCHAGYWVGLYDGTTIKNPKDYDGAAIMKAAGLPK